MDDKLNDFLKSLKHELFATRDSASEGILYACDLIETLPKEHRISAFTSLHVALNSVSDEIKNKLIRV